MDEEILERLEKGLSDLARTIEDTWASMDQRLQVMLKKVEKSLEQRPKSK